MTNLELRRLFYNFIGVIVGGLYLWGLRGLVQASWLVFISIIGGVK